MAVGPVKWRKIMAIALSSLVEEANRFLNVASFNDYCPNGLQVEGRPQVQKIVSGVTASQALLEAAVEAGADVLLVHHGYFWKGEDPCITGARQRRLKTLLRHEISLLAYHLPLDVHPQVGNNVQLARLLGIEVEGDLEPGNPRTVGLVGVLDQAMTLSDFALHVQQVLGRQPLVVEGPALVRRVGWCTGGGQGFIEQAVAAGVDVFLSGEASEQTFHSARENGIGFIAAGHHATERYGVQALGEHLARRFALEHVFIDCPNPF
jgi:dinuclear metal center YbgI/SA1388 family protein